MGLADGNSCKAEEFVARVEEEFGESVEKIEKLGEGKVIVYVSRESLPKVVSYVFWELGGRLATVVGSDERRLHSHFVVYYPLAMDFIDDGYSGKCWIIVASVIPGDDPRFPSVTKDIPAANWAEREIRDLLGLEPVGHPDPRRLVLPDDWPDGVYPLREEMDYTYSPPSKERPYTFQPSERIVKGTEVIELPIGPIHPASDEPGQFRVYVDGEEVVDFDYRLFHIHRGIEKLGVSRMTYNQVPFLAERICGICGYSHSCCYCQAVEEAFKVDVPERAEYIRSVMLEIERVHSHMLIVGLGLHLAAFDWGFMQLFKARERIMDLAEILTGNRKTYGMNVVGGVRRDFIKDRIGKAMDIVRDVRKRYREIVDIILSNRSVINRFSSIGILESNVARSLGVLGPTARASGLRIDVRKDHPYAAYRNLPLEVKVRDEGDVLSRHLVRLEEVFNSLDMIEHALDRLPGGPILAEKVEPIPHVRSFSSIEAPRGENFHFIVTGMHSMLIRWKVRAPTYNNWSAMPHMCRGYTLADIPLILTSIDPCYSCTERVMVVNVKKRTRRMMRWDELIHKSRKLPIRGCRS